MWCDVTGRRSVGETGKVRSFMMLYYVMKKGRLRGDAVEFTDARGTPLFTVRNKALAFHKTQLIEAMDGTDLCTIKKHFSGTFLSLSFFHSSLPHPLSPLIASLPPLPIVGTTRLTAHFHNSASDNSSIDLECKGDWFDRSAVITIAGSDRAVGQISRSGLNARQVFADQQTVSFTA